MPYHFTLVCPRCDKTSETISEKGAPSPHVNCGDCLMEYTEIVPMTVLAVRYDPENENGE